MPWLCMRTKVESHVGQRIILRQQIKMLEQIPSQVDATIQILPMLLL